MEQLSNIMDERQREMYKNFPHNHYLSKPEHVERVMDWVTYFRRNPAMFVEYYFNLSLHLYQCIILVLMDFYPSVCIVAARSAAKSFIIAVYACKEAILRPGARIVIASATKNQARLIVSEKIKKELLPRSPLLAAEIKSFVDNQANIEVTFYNGSSIVVVAAAESARGHRSTMMIYEEFRMIEKSVIDSILSPFSFIRQAPFLTDYPEYAALAEEPKEVYISSAWYKNHWMWDLIKNTTKSMITNNGACVIAMDYSITLKHNIKTRKFLAREKSKLDSVAWSIEYENFMISENAHAYFTYEMLNKNRVLTRPFYPRRNDDVISRVRNKHAIQKQKGEIRIVSCDIASEGGKNNDNSIFSCIRALPESREYKVSDSGGEHVQIKQGYRRQLLYEEPVTDFETSHQAIRIKQLFYDFDADFCVLDARNNGISIYDCLAKVLYDEDRNVEYPPWTCMNDDKMKSRIVITGQEPVLFAIKASPELNSKIAICMRNTLESKMFELLVNHQEGVEEIQKFIPDYVTADIDTQIYYEKPFLETAALINEMIALEYTVMSQTGYIRIEEKSTARKDRYTAASYGNYFIDLLEQDLFSDMAEYEYVPLYN